MSSSPVINRTRSTAPRPDRPCLDRLGPPRLLRVSATAVIVGGLAAVCAPSVAWADSTTWRPIDPGDPINGHAVAMMSPGYAIDGILGRGEAQLGRYANLQNDATGAYCIITGLPYSQAADIAETIDGQADPIVAYALSAYGTATDRDTTAAVSWIAHAYMDRGTADVSAEDRRAAFTASLEDAPASVRDRAQQIVREAEDYEVPPMDEASLATAVTITGSAADGTLAAVIDVPDGHPTEISVQGPATLEDGQVTTVIEADGTIPLTAGTVAQGETATVRITVDPVDDTVTAHATTIQTYRQAGTDARGRAYQVMAWAVPTTAELRTASAEVSWTAPYTPPADVSTAAADAADGDGIVMPGGTVQDVYTATGLAPGAGYRLETTVVSMADGTTVATTASDLVPEAADVRAVTAVELPADLAEGRYAVGQVLHGPDGTVLHTHDGTTTETQQFTVGIPTIGTTATDKADGDKTIARTGGTLVDTVAYENLPVGREVELRGTVMDKATGEVLRGPDGAEVTASARFTPEEASGTATVEFVLDGSVAGRTLVVFEDLVSAEGTVIAEHRDLADEGQTVVVEEAPPVTPQPTPPATPPTVERAIPPVPEQPVAPAPETPAPVEAAPEQTTPAPASAAPTTQAPSPVAPQPGPAVVGSTVHTGGEAAEPALPRVTGLLAALTAAGTGIGAHLWSRSRRGTDRRD